ncbi:triphosphoribosyl-dephospho-CoA synthase MdcB [Ignatzschineria ureiclastica]|uniref:triphosphoribosyl-dephospho-CoA synthase n=1 Tax=Ignatzschineria ureiclastica TaxID=472582 RepID=A0A2U2AGT5_9GAMM|nr:triphosphoribosyl-dephospho-CoA synthase [Ignatzschineria ureiclastica]PWD81862.1 triphosphoribosyl-dephospho-CoA synthase MdcB [Ignatzschineria ureiclastica]GGZ91028.1 triphosphoribosyl-dephospho-CoA synthase MdcB [Ignatzschineria ureiclastica]
MNRDIERGGSGELRELGIPFVGSLIYASQKEIATVLADQAVSALIEEVSLTPKPGLVDFKRSNAHKDMDWALLVASARALHDTFYQIALSGYSASLDQSLREKIAKIGRGGEMKMLQATGGVNTHKGAIWVLGLIIAVLAHQMSKAMVRGESVLISLTTLLRNCGQLASFTDRHYQARTLTKGQESRRKYGIRGALEEAQEGFPTLRKVIALPTTAKEGDLYWIERLLQLMSVVEDTCIISRSDLSTLHRVQQTASDILILGITTEVGQQAYQQLCQYCTEAYLSPGGSADLLAAIIFLEKVGVINGTVTF